MMMLRNRIMAAVFTTLCVDDEEAANEWKRIVALSVLSFLALC